MASEGEILQVSARYAIPNSGEAINVFTWRLLREISDSDLVTLVTFWLDTTWGGRWDDLASGACTLVDGVVTIIDTAGDILRNLGTAPVNIDGIDVGTADAAGVAGLLVAYVVGAGRQGRKYVPGIADTRLSNGIFNADTMTKLALLASVWVDVVMGSGQPTLQPGILSRVTQTFYPFRKEAGITDVPAYQRRRRPGSGS